MSAPLPSVTTLGEWLLLLSARPSDVSALERQIAASSVVLAYARAQARAEGLDESRAIVSAFEALRTRDGEAAAVDALARVGVDAYAVLDDVELEDAENAAQSERERRLDLYPWGSP